MAFLMHMLLSKQDAGIFIGSVLWLLLSCGFSSGVVSDINCLRSIKHSLEDPLGYLNSWDFNNQTEGFICHFLGIECWHSYENKVITIKLSDLGLKGQFPQGLANCTSLVGLDLSRNKLNGPLPTDIDRIVWYITSLDLSSNSFTGKIPAKLSNCSYLNVLKLDNNQFSGSIPPGLGQLPRLKTFSVANNQLSGQVPYFSDYISIGPESYANNSGLCGRPLKHCPPAIVKVLNSNNVVIAAAAGFGFGFSFRELLVCVIWWCWHEDLKVELSLASNSCVLVFCFSELIYLS